MPHTPASPSRMDKPPSMGVAGGGDWAKRPEEIDKRISIRYNFMVDDLLVDDEFHGLVIDLEDVQRVGQQHLFDLGTLGLEIHLILE